MTNAIGYIRVSTEEQSADDKYGIETQKRAISPYASGNGYEVADVDCVVIYTRFTNGGQDSICAADVLELKAYQNGTELSPLVPTGQKTDGYIQCDTNVQSGVTADVAWIFQLDDHSEVSVELPDGSKETISLE